MTEQLPKAMVDRMVARASTAGGGYSPTVEGTQGRIAELNAMLGQASDYTVQLEIEQMLYVEHRTLARLSREGA